MNTEKKDIGLSIHRITQYVITAAAMVLMYSAKHIYEEVTEIGKDVSAIRTSIAIHGQDISELRMDLREVQKEVHSITAIQKPKRP
jgi:septation ring formation regulator EzrA